MFSSEFYDISHNTVFRDPFLRLLLLKHLFCLLSHHKRLAFQKRCHAYFPAEYFLGLIFISNLMNIWNVQPGARSLFFTQPNICDGAFLQNSEQLKAVKYFCKNESLERFDRVLNTPQKVPTKRCSKVKN